MQDKITTEKLNTYFSITEEAFSVAKEAKISAKLQSFESQRADFLDMIERYIADAKHFKQKNDFINAFAALNYAHGWLDAGARLGLWDVHDNRLFTVD